MSKKRTFSRRWPVYLTMVLICITSVAVLFLVMSDISAPSRTNAPQASSAPKGIR